MERTELSEVRGEQSMLFTMNSNSICRYDQHEFRYVTKIQTELAIYIAAVNSIGRSVYNRNYTWLRSVRSAHFAPRSSLRLDPLNSPKYKYLLILCLKLLDANDSYRESNNIK